MTISGCPPLQRTADRGYDQQYEEDEKQDLSDVGGGTGDTGETKNSGYQSEDEKCNGPVEHDGVWFGCWWVRNFPAKPWFDRN